MFGQRAYCVRRYGDFQRVGTGGKATPPLVLRCAGSLSADLCSVNVSDATREAGQFAWMIPVSAALAYPAAMLAYVIYFGAFEPQRLANSIGHSQTASVLIVLFLGATASFAWLFGAIAGAVFFLMERTWQAARARSQQ